MNLRGSFLLAACFCAAPLHGGESGPVPPARAYFTIAPPAGWTRTADPTALSAQERKVFGEEYAGPVSRNVQSRISVRYYAPGNMLHKTYERFIKLHSRPPFGVNADKKVYGPVKDGLAGSRHAKVFERKVFEYVPAGAANPEKVAVYERFAVVPAKQGFYVLRYTAQADIAKDGYKAYETVLASFKALVK